MSMLTRAARKFDLAFAALPREVQQAVMLAIYRALPAMQQYQHDLEPLTQDQKIIDATWDILIAGGFRLVKKGQDASHFSDKEIDELKACAPATYDFLHRCGQLVSGLIPGMPAVIDVEAAATTAIAERSIPDAETTDL